MPDDARPTQWWSDGKRRQRIAAPDGWELTPGTTWINGQIMQTTLSTGVDIGIFDHHWLSPSGHRDYGARYGRWGVRYRKPGDCWGHLSQTFGRLADALAWAQAARNG